MFAERRFVFDGIAYLLVLAWTTFSLSHGFAFQPPPQPIHIDLNEESVFCVDPDEDRIGINKCDDFNPVAVQCDFDKICDPNNANGKCKNKNKPDETTLVEVTILNAGAATGVDVFAPNIGLGPSVWLTVVNVIPCYSELDCECKLIQNDWVCKPKHPLRIYDLYRTQHSTVGCDF